MVMFLCTFAIGFLWLLRETDWLRVRLPVGKPIRLTFTNCMEFETPKRVMACPEIKPTPVYLLPQTCQLTRIQQGLGASFNHYRYHGGCNTKDKESYQQVTIGGHTVSILAASPKLYDVIIEAQKVADGKDRKVSFKPCQLPMNAFIEQVRTGSEKVQHGMRGRRRYYQYDDTYKTIFHDCLCGKEWLEAHYKDVIPEPTIEITVGDKSISLNGDFKTGMIKSFVKANRG